MRDNVLHLSPKFSTFHGQIHTPAWPVLITIVHTGAGGFVGTEVTKQLLERGYTVRATVRDKQSSSVGHLLGLGDALPGTLEIAEADLSIDGSFDEAIKGSTFVYILVFCSSSLCLVVFQL